MPVLHQHDNDSDQVKIIHEKEKTKRYFLYIGSLVFLALVGIYFAAKNGGVVSGNLKDGSISVNLQKPIVAQAAVATKSFETPRGTVEYTTGKVDAGIINSIQPSQGSISSNSFSGENFINKEAGFLFSIGHPGNWEVASTTSIGNASIINNFISRDGQRNNLNVVIEQLPPGVTISDYTQASIAQMNSAGMISGEPGGSYDAASNTALIYYQNTTTGGPTIQKYIVNKDKAYIATANFSPMSDNSETQTDMLSMIGSFTLISN
ncbi:MAG: hypothetical protein ABI778_05210 [Ignavibacteriota bacterium]